MLASTGGFVEIIVNRLLRYVALTSTSCIFVVIFKYGYNYSALGEQCFCIFQIFTAVKFLQNPNVQKSSLAHRQAFLRKKGLTEEEIQIACNRAGAFQNHHNDGVSI